VFGIVAASNLSRNHRILRIAATELSHLPKEAAVSFPSPPLEERVGERRPSNAAPANSLALILQTALLLLLCLVNRIAPAQTRPFLEAKDAAVIEGNSGTTNLIFVISLSKPASETVMVDYATRDASALAGSDYSAAFGVAVFSPGITNQEILASVNGDKLSEADETFWLMLTNAVNAILVRDHAIGTILDDDSPPALSINDVALVEDYSETTNAIFNVSLSAVSGQTITVEYVTATASALAGYHFEPVSDVLTFVPGDTRQTLAVPVTGGSVNAVAETFSVNLLNPMNATIARNRATATIMNDGPLRTFLANRHSQSPGRKTESLTPPPKPSLDPARPVSVLPVEKSDLRSVIRPATGSEPTTHGLQPVLKATKSVPEKSSPSPPLEERAGERRPFPYARPPPFDNFQTRSNPSVANNSLDVLPRQGAHLSLGLLASTNFVHVEQSLTFSVVVTNNGPESASSVFVTNRLPGSATFLSAQNSQGTYARAKDLIIFNLGTLSNSSRVAATISLKFSGAGLATNIVQVAAAEVDAVPTNNSCSAVVLAINDLPKISAIPGQVTRENVPTTPIPFVVTDAETPANDLILFGTSSNTNLVPDENFIFGGISSDRTLILVPAPNGVGATEISVTALDSEGGEASTDFTLTVLPTFRVTLRIEPAESATPPPKIERIERAGDWLKLYFDAEPGQTYAVECCDSFDSSWQTLTNMSASSTSTLLEFLDPIAGPLQSASEQSSPSPPLEERAGERRPFTQTRSQRFYRLSVSGATQPSASPMKLSFDAMPGQSYTIEYCDSLGAGSWHALTNIGPVSTQSTLTVSDSTVSQPQRFYRLRSP